MRLYFEIAAQSARRSLQYRSAIVAGALTNAFFGAIRSFVYIALYQAGGAVAGLTLSDVITYTWVTQALLSIGAAWIASDIAGTIRSGDVITDLGRPWNFYAYWFCRSNGEKLFNLLNRGAITYVIGVLYFGARIPTPGDLLPFALSVALALVIVFALTFMVNMTAFWLIEATGVFLIVSVLLSFFSGFMLPLAFLPPWLRVLADVLPFQAITSMPAQVFMGKLAGPDLVAALLNQVVWAVVMTGCALLAMRVAVRRVVIQGG